MAHSSQPAHHGAPKGGHLKSFRSPDQLVAIYRASQENRPQKEIAAELGISVGSVATALAQLDKYLKGKDRGQRKHSYNYREAVRLIRRDKRQEPPQVNTELHRQPQTTPAGDNYTFLKRSFDRFQGDVATFLEVETNSRYAVLRDENKALTEDNRALRKEVERLHAEIERLKVIEPHTIDWIDTLQNKLEEKEEA